jgi:hypothetical protein
MTYERKARKRRKDMKKLFTLLAVGALVLSMAAVGSATTLEVNIYGASAQFNFWSAMAQNYLTTGPAGCTGGYGDNTTSGYSPSPSSTYHGAKYFIAEATGPCASWTGVASTDVFRIRVGAYDSSDGIQSVASGGTTNPLDYLGCTGHQRTLLTAYLGSSSATNVTSNLGCFDVHLGAADVNGSSVIQTTEGQLDGPAGPASPDMVGTIDLGNLTAPSQFVSPSIVPQDTCTNSALDLIDHHPFIVPFAFYANISAGGSDNLANHLAGLCTSGSTGCSSVTTTFCPPGSTSNCVTKNLTNGALPGAGVSLTQTMVEDIFSRKVTDWSTYFPTMESTPIILCMRVAGSGTMATFDAGVMRTNGNESAWPGTDFTISGSDVWFNNTSGDMLNCINGVATAVPSNAPSGSGAIGFIDADTSISSATNTFGPLYFDGQLPIAQNIQYGLYDRFWTLEHIFEANSTISPDWVGNTSSNGKWVNYDAGYPNDAIDGTDGMLTWGATQLPPSRSPYYVLSGSMKVHKANDFAYPPIRPGYSNTGGTYGVGPCYE